MDLKSGYPFLLIKSGLPYDYPKLQQDIRTDVTIIGSGISGALTAYYLTNAGFSCVVVDARSVALGSTCASTSLLQYELDKPLCMLKEQTGLKTANAVYTMCSDAIDTVEKICKKIRFQAFHRKNSLYYAAYKKDAPMLEKEYRYRREAGFDVALLGPDDIMERYGFTAPAAILSSQGADINAYMFTHALHQHGMHKGLKVYDRTRISHITYHHRSAELRTENDHVIRTKFIVNATGYEVHKLLEGVGSLQSTYAVCSEQLSEKRIWKGNDLIWNTGDPYLYMRTTSDNRIFVGGRDENFYSPALRDKLLKRKTAQLTGDFNKLFPGAGFVPEFSWTGTFATTKDALPYIGTHPRFPHTFFALGFGGNGITFSVIAAEIIRDLMLKKKNQSAAMFRFDR
jgi:glycine/D-amino acid oxidase-like deaminating enzyme